MYIFKAPYFVKYLRRFCNYYQILGVGSTADTAELKRAFRCLSKELHPDTTSIPHELAARKFQEVCEAYTLLSDPGLRASYDLALLKESEKRAKRADEYEPCLDSLGKQGEMIGVRRSLSGGELFSLSLLGLTLTISLSLAIAFALVQGKELFVIPSWMMIQNHVLYR